MSIAIGKTFKRIIDEKRLSLKLISKETGVPNSTLAEWLNNRSPKNPEQVRKVSKYLGVSLHYFLFGEEDSEEPLHKILKEDLFSGTFEVNIKRIKVEGIKK